MRIQEVIKETGLSKRTIHYYIEEQLISPEVNTKNSYNIFSKTDVEQLKFIQQLRKADFSIHDIRQIMRYPNTIHYFLQKQEESLGEQLNLLQQKINCLKMLERQLPIIVSFDDISKNIDSINFSNHIINKQMSKKESGTKLVCLFLWSSFLKDLPMTEYRQYLWNKIVNEMTNSKDVNISILKKHLNLLSAVKLDEEFTRRYNHIQMIVKLSIDECNDYIDCMKKKLADFLESSSLQVKWCDTYFSLTLPLTCLFDSSFNDLIYELSPFYADYSNNIIYCCEKLYHWLYTSEGKAIRLELLQKLNGYLNIDEHYHGELEALVNFI